MKTFGSGSVAVPRGPRGLKFSYCSHSGSNGIVAVPRGPRGLKFGDFPVMAAKSLSRGPSWAAWIEIPLQVAVRHARDVAVPRGPRGLKCL